MAKRPLVNTAIRTEFGDVLEDAAFHDVSGADRDLTYVPGFSEMRRERDRELAAVASGEKQRHEMKLKNLPVNLHWVRKTTPRGAPDGLKQISTGNLGYRTVHKDQIGKVDWLTSLPPGVVIDADGSLVKGDTVLMVADGKTAARNAARRAAQTRRMTEDAQAAAGGLLAIAGKKAGVEPYVTQEA